ncbi:MAG TPA: protein kinase [Candidatus Polarisedimenticolaceae bacterium]|nr:protein kinase [Candidatus Polarisedimenticolaceae bacterium]
MPLIPGTRLGPYEVVAPLGAGGMGEVYRARDPRLGREVAIKVLPDLVAKDPDRLARFEREARLLAALGHAGIASIFGVEDAGSTPALVMELVEGPTLAERIAQGPLPPEEALPVARQLADALEYAHEHGIVHRDLKPANIKLRPDGTVKVLDFGLARALELEAGSASNSAHSPTLTQGMTRDGIIVGTAAYMAPEQARGKPADRRADIWAFGVVLYEMLAGRLLFAGETTSDTLAAVMRDEPDWSALPQNISPRWRALLRRCLTKDPRQRLQSIGEARIALDDLASNPNEPLSTTTIGASPAAPARRSLLPWLIAAAALLALGAVTFWPKAPPVSYPTELSVVPHGGWKIGLDNSYIPIALSPDGKKLAYTVREEGTLQLRLRRLDTREDVEIENADGARNLFFSPDSEWIGFFDTRKMSKVSVHGGTPVALADSLQDRLGTWLDDGTIVYARDTTEALFRIPENGGTPTEVTKLDPAKRERTHRFPCALDGGPWVVFTVQTVDNPGSYDGASIDAVNVKSGERRHLFTGARRAAWGPGGYLLLVRGSDLYAVPIDPKDPRIEQEPVPVLANISGDGTSGASYFSLARDGTLAWIPGGEPEKMREIGWFDREGRWTATKIPVGPYTQLRLAPDGRRALVLVGGGGSSDLWLADLETGGMNRLTHDGRANPGALSPDGVHLVYSRGDRTGTEMVVVRRLDGQGGERELYRASNPLIVTAVTADGKNVLFSDYGLRTGKSYMAALAGSSPARAFQPEGEGTSTEQGPVASPDGKWLAYVTTKTRREEVCVRRLDGSGASWQLSSKGAGGVRWGREDEVFLVTGEILCSVPLGVSGGTLAPGQPEELFEAPPSPTEATYRDYDYDRRTDRFLFTRPPRGTAERREIALSLGWAGKLGTGTNKN